MVKKNSKELILNAAEEVVLEKGAAHMSLDIVAKKAGISKGGLLYNFPNKDALLKSMVSRLVTEFYTEREKKIAGLKESKGRLLKAEILSILDSNEKRDRTALSILAAVAQSPDLLEPVRKAHQDHLQWLVNSGLPFEQATIISLASDGLMFLDLLHLTPFSDGQRERIKKEMLRLIEMMESTKE